MSVINLKDLVWVFLLFIDYAVLFLAHAVLIRNLAVFHSCLIITILVGSLFWFAVPICFPKESVKNYKISHFDDDLLKSSPKSADITLGSLLNPPTVESPESFNKVKILRVLILESNIFILEQIVSMLKSFKSEIVIYSSSSDIDKSMIEDYFNFLLNNSLHLSSCIQLNYSMVTNTDDFLFVDVVIGDINSFRLANNSLETHTNEAFPFAASTMAYSNFIETPPSFAESIAANKLVSSVLNPIVASSIFESSTSYSSIQEFFINDRSNFSAQAILLTHICMSRIFI